MKVYHINPIGKPRMVRSDAWKKRDCVQRYWAFKDLVKKHKISIPDSGAHIKFYIPMPVSWSKKRKGTLNGLPHRGKPDIDNLLKALMDAVFEDDSHIYNIQASKYLSYEGMIIIE